MKNLSNLYTPTFFLLFKSIFTKICLLTIPFFIISCNEQNDFDLSDSQQLIEFSVLKNGTGDNHGRIASLAGIDEMTQAVITIAFADGSATEFTDTPIDLFTMDGKIFTEKVALKEGSYLLEAFGLANDNNEIKFAVPLQSSPLSANVSHPLTIAFDVASEAKTTIDLEVIEVEQQDPSAFGFNFFEVELVETIDFLISVSELGGATFINSTLTISYGEDFEYVQELFEPISIVQVQAQSDWDYLIEVTAEDYETFNDTLELAELLSYETDEKVFEVELTKDEGGDRLWYASSYDAGEENVTYVFEYEISTPSPYFVFYGLINGNGFDTDSLGQPSVSAEKVNVTIDGQMADIVTTENSSYNYGSGFFIRLVDPSLATEGARVVVIAEGITNNINPGTYSWQWIRTATGAGWPIDEFDPEPLVLE